MLALPALGSDHSPLLLSTEATQRCKQQRSFYFEAYWLQDMECRSTIAASWASSQLGDMTLHQKLQAISAALSRWSRSKFINAKHQISFLNNQLQILTNQPHGHLDKVVLSDQTWRQLRQSFGISGRPGITTSFGSSNPTLSRLSFPP